jgi:hypothetical protein
MEYTIYYLLTGYDLEIDKSAGICDGTYNKYWKSLFTDTLIGYKKISNSFSIIPQIKKHLSKWFQKIIT